MYMNVYMYVNGREECLKHGEMPGKTSFQQENAASRHQHVRHFKSEFLFKRLYQCGRPSNTKNNKTWPCLRYQQTSPPFSHLQCPPPQLLQLFFYVFLDTELQAEVLIHFCCSYYFAVRSCFCFGAFRSTLLFLQHFRRLQPDGQNVYGR